MAKKKKKVAVEKRKKVSAGPKKVRPGSNFVPLAHTVENSRLTPIRFVERKNGRPIWLMRCSCGVEKLVNLYDYQSGRSLSCGCYFRELMKNMSHSPTTKLPPGTSARNSIFDTYKRAAKLRDIVFALDRDLFNELIVGNCVYCNSPPRAHCVKRRANGSFWYNGIDRINNSMGYCVGNVVTCCKICNKAKQKMSVKEFLDWIASVAEHSLNLKEEQA